MLCYQGASRTAEDGDRERRAGDDRDERIGGAPRGSATRGIPPGPNPGPANRVRNGPEQAISNPASRVQQSGKSYVKLLMCQREAELQYNWFPSQTQNIKAIWIL